MSAAGIVQVPKLSLGTGIKAGPNFFGSIFKNCITHKSLLLKKIFSALLA
jgi:hypothetical protein